MAGHAGGSAIGGLPRVGAVILTYIFRPGLGEEPGVRWEVSGGGEVLSATAAHGDVLIIYAEPDWQACRGGTVIPLTTLPAQ